MNNKNTGNGFLIIVVLYVLISIIVTGSFH